MQDFTIEFAQSILGVEFPRKNLTQFSSSLSIRSRSSILTEGIAQHEFSFKQKFKLDSLTPRLLTFSIIEVIVTFEKFLYCISYTLQIQYSYQCNNLSKQAIYKRLYRQIFKISTILSYHFKSKDCHEAQLQIVFDNSNEILTEFA